MKKILLPIGADYFAGLIRDHQTFVDKTLFIQEFLEGTDEVTLLLRPRRWGKSMMMSMLHHFLASKVYGQETARLFDGLKIARAADGEFLKKHQGKYPAIFISFKDVESDNCEGAISRIKIIIQNLYREHRPLLSAGNLDEEDKSSFEKFLRATATTEELADSVRFLSELLFKYYQQPVYILIDEYDKPMNTAYEYGYLDGITPFMKGLLGSAFKGNPYLAKGLLTGVLRLSKDSMLSSLNNLRVYSVFDRRYSKHYGFSEEEVKQLLEKCELGDKFPAIREWYDGYSFGEYNPWSIVNCLADGGELASYWVQTSSDELLIRILPQTSKEIKENFIALMNGEAIDVWVDSRVSYDGLEKNEAALWSLLTFAGYLKVTEVKERAFLQYHCCLKIPNKEVNEVYTGIFRANLKNRYKRKDQLVVSLSAGRVADFIKELRLFLLSVASIYDMGKEPEAFYQGVIVTLLALIQETHYVWSNRESGLGRPDFIVIPKDQRQDRAMIIELKRVHPEKGETLTSQVQEALQQIDLKHYKATLGEYPYITHVSKIGIAFLGKEVQGEETMTDVELSSLSEEESLSPKESPERAAGLERGFWGARPKDKGAAATAGAAENTRSDECKVNRHRTRSETAVEDDADEKDLLPVTKKPR